jgi:hypothetical protein
MNGCGSWSTAEAGMLGSNEVMAVYLVPDGNNRRSLRQGQRANN